MTWKFDSRWIGYPPIENFLTTAALALSTGLVQSAAQWPPIPVGVIIEAEDPVWGAGEFIFAKANGTIPLRAVCQLLPVWNSTNRNFDWNATAAANTANLGSMLCVAMSEQTSTNALTTGQFGWFMVSGITPMACGANLAIGAALGVTAAGQGGAFAAGKQILPARVITPSTQTVVVASRADPAAVSAGFVVAVANTDGFFCGGVLTGTGMGVSTIVTAIDRINNLLTVSVANTAVPSGNITITYATAAIFYNTVSIYRPFSQGQIT